MAAPYQRPTLLVDGVDYTEYLVPSSFTLNFQVQQGVASGLSFTLRETPGAFSVEGGKIVEFYLEGEELPLFSGLQSQVVPQRYAPQTWQYVCDAVGWESVFFRKQLFTTIRGVSFEGACNQVLADPEQTYPTSILNVVKNTSGVLNGDMPFFSVNGAFPGEIFDLISNLTGTVWRVTANSATEFQLEFLDPFTTLSGFQLTETNKSFRWDSFAPVISTAGVINTQSLKGSQAALDTEETAYFRGDGLSSQFDLPTKPFNNEASVILFDSFNSAPINTSIWFESDVVGNKVYADGVGFVQFEDATAWVGLISRALADRDSSPMVTVDLTWVGNGIAMFGFTGLEAVPLDSQQFLDAGIYIDGTGKVFGVAGGNVLGDSGVVLSASTQYRFRVKTKSAGGCRLEYQAGTDIYTRNWTVLFDTNTGTVDVLGTAVMSYSADFSLAMVKTVYPYLGVKLEVDRGDGFEEEEVGIYPIDEDVDAVILEESTLAFFGSNPGPSTIPPAPSWQTDPDYKNIKVTYRRGVNIFATYRDNDSIAAISALFGGNDSGIREGSVLVDDSITSYQAALARCKTEVDNRGNIVSSITADTSVNILSDAGVPLPEAGLSATYEITLPDTSYVISRNIPIRKIRYTGRTGLNDYRVQTEAGYLNRGLRSVLAELKASGKLISINENQVIYVGKSVQEAIDLNETVTNFGAGTTARWGDSRLSKTFTANATTNLITTSASTLFVTGDEVLVSSTGTLPAPLSDSTVYYINRQSTTTYYLYNTYANAIAGGATGRTDITNTGSGTHTLSAYGWRYGQHRWNSFMKDAELRGSATLVATAKTFKRWHAQGTLVLNVVARTF